VAWLRNVLSCLSENDDVKAKRSDRHKMVA